MHPRTEVIQSGKVRNLDVTESLTYQGSPVVPGGGGVTGFTGTLNTTAPNDTINVAVISVNTASINGDFVLATKGTGSILADVPDSAVIGGNKRGTYAVDLQLQRNAANQVAAGSASVIVGGLNNRIDAAANTSFIGGGWANISLEPINVVVGGQGNSNGGNYSFIGAGLNNTIGMYRHRSAIVGGESNSITSGGERSFIGGGVSHSITNNHSAIVGGSTNSITHTYGFIGGGFNNRLTNSDAYGVIAGGEANTVSQGRAFLGAGYNNNCYSGYAFLGGGFSNTCQASWGFLGSGASNTAGGTYSGIVAGQSNTTAGTTTHKFIGGGYFNNIGTSGGYGAIVGGQLNTVNADNAFIGGGQSNSASGLYSSVLGGFSNSASGSYSSIPGGRGSNAAGIDTIVVGSYGIADRNGMHVRSNGFFTAAGDSQVQHFILRRITTDAVQTELSTDGLPPVYATTMDIPNDTTIAFEIMIVARRTDADNESASWILRGCIDNNAGTTALVGAVTSTTIADDSAGAWQVTAVADNPNDRLQVLVTGQTSKTIRWVADVKAMRVTG